jgi:plasmid segregation protein ParM
MNIGLDVGYSAVKAISGNRRAAFPSVVGTPDKARFAIGTPGNSIVLTEPDHVLIGAGAVQQSRHLKRREDRAWTQSQEWYLLALAAWTELTTVSVDLTVITGLPVAFYGDKDAVVASLLGEHSATREGRNRQTFKIAQGSVRVIPQPFGALLAAALNNTGNVVNDELADGNVGVIDVGGKTTNLLSVDGLTEISRETSSVSVGAWDVARAVRVHLADRCPELELRDHKLMNAITKRQVKYFGEPVDFGPVVDAALEPMADQVIAEATQLWNGAAGLDAILVTGGGALLLGDRLRQHFRHARIVEQPVWANALGFYRFAQYLSNTKQ